MHTHECTCRYSHIKITTMNYYIIVLDHLPPVLSGLY